MGTVESTIDNVRMQLGGCLCIELEAPNPSINNSGPEALGETSFHAEDEYDSDTSTSSSSASCATDSYSEGSQDNDGYEGDSKQSDHDMKQTEAVADTSRLSASSAHVPALMLADASSATLTKQDSWSSGPDEPVPSNLDVLHKQKTAESLIPSKSKLMIHLAHLLAKVIKDYFESEANQCEFAQIDVESILQHIIITGDAPRNYLLGVEMSNTLDIMVDTRELTKLHLQHLRQHHSTHEQQTSYSQCILWNHYLNKFEKKCIHKDLEMQQQQFENHSDATSAAYISECDYILNAKLITSAILQSSELSNKLSLFCDDTHHFALYQLQIIDDLTHGTFNLDGVNFNVFDHHLQFHEYFILHRFEQKFESNHLRPLMMRKYHNKTREKLNQSHQQNGLYMYMDDEAELHESNMHIRLSTRKLNDDLPIFQSAQLIQFEIPRYQYRLSRCIQNYDHSLQFLVLPFSAIVDCFDDGFLYAHDRNNEQQAVSASVALSSGTSTDDILIDYDWRSKIINGVTNYNAFDDLRKKRITHPSLQRLEQVFQGKPHIFFWRLIKLCILCVEFQIDPKLITFVQQHYHAWIDNDQFLVHSYEDDDDDEHTSSDGGDFDDEKQPTPSKKEEKKHYGYEPFLNTLFNDNLCASWLDYKTMLERFKAFQFDTVLIKQLSKSSHFKEAFVRELNDEDDDVIDLFAQFHYPVD